MDEEVDLAQLRNPLRGRCYIAVTDVDFERLQPRSANEFAHLILLFDEDLEILDVLHDLHVEHDVELLIAQRLHTAVPVVDVQAAAGGVRSRRRYRGCRRIDADHRSAEPCDTFT